MAINYKGFNTSRHDYNHPLKYYGVVHRVLARQQELSEKDLELIITLDDEYFTKSRFEDVKYRGGSLDKLIEAGWFEEYRPYKPPSQSALYRPTSKAHHLVKRIYRILDGAEDLPMSAKRNPIMKENAKLSTSEELLKKAALLMQEDRHKNRYNG